MPREKGGGKLEKVGKKDLGVHGDEQRKAQSAMEHKTKLSSGKKYIDTETWVEKHLDDLIDVFNLSMLELNRDEARAIAVKLVDILRGESSSIDKDTIRRRFNRHAQNMHQLIAQLILEFRENLSMTQLEFVVNNIGEAVLSYAPRLYRETVKYGREDLLDIVRSLWKTYWVSKKYGLLPVECPRCKFNSLMPDMSCIVCSASISEEELKRNIDFEKMLMELADTYNEEDLKKTIIYGYVYVNSLGLKPPTHERDKLDIEILLTSREKEILKSVLASSRGSSYGS